MAKVRKMVPPSECAQRRLLAHRCGISHLATCRDDLSEQLGDSDLEARLLVESATAYFKENTTLKPAFKKAVLAFLNTVVNPVKDPVVLRQAIKAGENFILQVPVEQMLQTHFSTVVSHKAWAAFCYQEEDRPILSIKFIAPLSELEESLLSKLIEEASLTTKECHQFQKANPPKFSFALKRKKFGNGSWVSLKAALLAACFFALADVRKLGLGELSQEGIEELFQDAKTCYHNWTLWDRVYAFNEYRKCADAKPEMVFKTAMKLTNMAYCRMDLEEVDALINAGKLISFEEITQMYLHHREWDRSGKDCPYTLSDPGKEFVKVVDWEKRVEKQV
tara:strand:- start:10191 stop:11195 length:1005 start_codon:yes stop_codon:yes gene_type:complete